MRPAARSRRGMQQNHTTSRGRKGRSRAAEYRYGINADDYRTETGEVAAVKRWGKS